jgi:hypothetical protein
MSSLHTFVCILNVLIKFENDSKSIRKRFITFQSKKLNVLRRFDETYLRFADVSPIVFENVKSHELEAYKNVALHVSIEFEVHL